MLPEAVDLGQHFQDLSHSFFSIRTSQPANNAYIEDNTWARVDMENLFECSTRYLTSEPSERVRYKVEHDKRYYISTSNHVLFCLLYRHTDADVFWWFPEDFWPLSEASPKIVRRPHERLRVISENFRKLPKINEDKRRLPKTFEEDPNMFRSYTNKFKYSLRVKHVIFFSAHRRAEFNKSCNLIGSWSGRNFLIRTATAGGIRRVDLFSWTN